MTSVSKLANRAAAGEQRPPNGGRTMHPFKMRIAQRKERAIAFTDGTTEVVENNRTGEPYERERWLFLPKSQIMIDDEMPDGQCTVYVPEWLAKDKGLL